MQRPSRASSPRALALRVRRVLSRIIRSPIQASARRRRSARSLAAPLRAGGCQHLGELALEADLLAQRGDAALEGERGHRHLPPAVDRADDAVLRGARAVEEDLAELGRARHLR